MIGDPVTHSNSVVCPPSFENFRFQNFCIAVTLTNPVTTSQSLPHISYFFVHVANVH